jgi:hypothetical protein
MRGHGFAAQVFIEFGKDRFSLEGVVSWVVSTPVCQIHILFPSNSLLSPFPLPIAVHVLVFQITLEYGFLPVTLL